MNDLRFAFRRLLKSPGFTLVAILTLALGIGASTAIFSVVDAVLLRPLPYPEQERLVELRELDETGHAMALAEPNFHDLQQQSRSFAAMAHYNSGPDAVVGGREPIRTTAATVSPDFFRVLGVKPFLGRFFSGTRADDQTAVVSYGFWQRSLGSRATLEGTTLRLEDHLFTVSGVMPPGKEFPREADVWFPSAIYPKNTSRTAHNWNVIARLRDGASPEQSQAEIATIGQALKRQYGHEIDATSFALTPLREGLVKNVRGLLYLLCGAVGLLLFIACSNVANLLLVRATHRRREIALRAALGASRAQLTRHFLTETLLLTLIAGGLGVLLANWGVDLIPALYHGDLPRVGAIGVNQTVLLFTLALSLGVALLLGFVPALHLSPAQLQNDLQESGQRSSSGRSSARVRNALVIAQVALTLVLLLGAGLLGRSFQRLLAVDPGFQPESVVTMSISKSYPETAAARARLVALYQRLLERLRDLPGVIAVGGIDSLPMSGEGTDGGFIIEHGGQTARTLDELGKEYAALAGSPRLGHAEFRVASTGYFSAMRIPLRRGRFFSGADGPEAEQVAVVNQAFVRRFFPHEEAIGQQLQYGGMDGDLHLLRVVGVAGDVHDNALEAPPSPMLYVDFRQRPGHAWQFTCVLRGRGEAASSIAAMRREARAVDPEMPTEFRTMQQMVSSSLDRRRFSMMILGVFSAVALVLAMVGLYGVMAYLTSQRTRELGIRMALGAQRGDLLRLVLRQSFILVAAGIALGVLGALGGTRLLGTMLYGVGAADLPTYLAVILLLGAAALLASFVPARRAMKVNPIEALRAE